MKFFLIIKKNTLNALRRSYALFTTNFWGILGRIVLITVLSLIVTIAISQNNKTGILVAIVNTVLGWFSICYSIALYKQVAKGNEHLPGKSIKGLVIFSLVGYMVLILIIGGIINIASKNLPSMNNTNSPQHNTPPTEAEMQQMLQQLPEGQSMQFEDQSI